MEGQCKAVKRAVKKASERAVEADLVLRLQHHRPPLRPGRLQLEAPRRAAWSAAAVADEARSSQRAACRRIFEL